MPPAARITDLHACPLVTPGTPPVPHVGGPVVKGSPNVFVAFMPQARVGDQCICVGPPDAIAMGSPTVLVNGMMAARMGDPTVHGGMITSGAPTVLIGVAGFGSAAGAPPALVDPVMIGPLTSGNGPPPVAPPPEMTGRSVEGSFERRLGGDENIDVMFLDARGAASAGNGRLSAGGEAKLGLLQTDHYGHRGWVGGGHHMEHTTAEGELYGSVGWTGLGLQADGSARVSQQGGSLALGRDENNPLLRVDGQYEMLSAETKNRLLIGSDGREAGLEIGSVHKASVLSGEARGEVGFRIPFTNWTVTAANRVSGEIGSAAIGGNVHAKRDADGIYRAGGEAHLGAGVELGGHAGRDQSTGRYHLGAKVGIDAILGGLLDIDLSIGPAYDSRDRRH